ncbi:hypothetical protein RHGRI_010682 [Rhododendron griersonianum]|uniref:Uncharacterized protein n=1 Tax=Rhododendron griersonianum TaxID=479676 RepID=A0AAV6KK02_9ERIC|nr:hypothetical protein RHGRI_018219 [Rhododendron griersonianum]KAG5552665.1 hypothetical protein RHGRI_010682 [Rhododendron griersonianum]
MELKQRLGDPSQLIGAQQQKIVAAPKKSLAVAQPSAAAQSKPLPPYRAERGSTMSGEIQRRPEKIHQWRRRSDRR